MKTNYIGAFEANTDDFLLQLWFDLQPFIKKYSTNLVEDNIFNGIVDFLDENQDHWFWDRLETDLATEDSVYQSITNLSKQLAKEYSNKLWKPVRNNFGEIVEWQAVELIKDKYELPKWKNTKTTRTSNGILVRYSTKNEIALKGLTPKGVIMSVKDYQVFCNETKLDLNTLTPPMLEKWITDLEMNLHPEYWKQYPTMRTFEESILVEKGIKTEQTIDNQPVYQLGLGFVNQKKSGKADWKSHEETLDVFDLEL